MDSNRRDPRKHPVGRSVVCYFCNEFFEDKYLQDHIIQCGAVLEPCPKKCGAYFQRSLKDKHIMECRYKKPRPRSTHELMQQTFSVRQQSVNDGTEFLETEIVALRSALSEERRYRQESQIEIHRLQKLYQKSEEYNKHLSMTLDNLKRSLYEELEKRKSSNAQAKLELDKINLQYQVLDEWKKQVDAGVEYVKNRLIENDNKLLDSEFSLKNHENRFALLDRLEMDMNMLHQKINDDQISRQEETNSWRGELNDFKDFFSQENAMIGALWTEQRDEIDKLKNAIEVQANGLNDFKTKYHSIIFDTKSVTQMAIESSDKLDLHTNEIKDIKQMLEQLKLDFSNIEKSVGNNSTATMHNGRILWKIDDFKEKMNKAREFNTILHSPVFYSSLYGYKLRLEIYLNGIKKWRGRHVIVSLQVLKGEWDPLLPWPCNIEAKMLLRDQSTQQAKNFIKYITAKRLVGDEENEDPQESSSQYIFITHATLDKQNFIKDNSLFIETIVINDNLTTVKKSVEVTTL